MFDNVITFTFLITIINVDKISDDSDRSVVKLYSNNRMFYYSIFFVYFLFFTVWL